MAGAVRHRPRGARGPRLPAGRGHRPAVEGRLAGQGPPGPRPPRRLPRAPGRPVDAFLERIKGRELPGFDVASAWLRAHRPIDYIPGLMHGDYQFANVMYRARRAGAAGRHRRLGDGHGRRPEARPRLGGAELARGHERAEAADVGLRRHDRHADARRRSLAHYAEVSGRQVDDIDYYVILAKWKLAVVLEQGFQRAGDDEKLLRRSGRSCSTSCRARPSWPRRTDYRVSSTTSAEPMRAAVCRAHGPPEVVDGSRRCPRPTPAPGQVRVRVARRGRELPRRAARRRTSTRSRCRRRSCRAASSPASSTEVGDGVTDVRGRRPRVRHRCSSAPSPRRRWSRRAR